MLLIVDNAAVDNVADFISDQYLSKLASPRGGAVHRALASQPVEGAGTSGIVGLLYRAPSDFFTKTMGR